MIGQSLCIEPAELRAFSLGRTSEGEALQIEEHLTHCSHCLERMRQFSDRDTLIEAFRAQTVTIRPKLDPERLEKVIQSATQLFVSSTSESPPLYDADELRQLGEYRLVKELGRGGMGIVYEAEDRQLHRKVAIKALLPRHVGNGDSQARFVRESRSIAGLDHENIVPIYHVGEERGIPFFVMPLLAGETLESKWRRAGALPLAEVLQIGSAVAEGLAVAHRRGIVHRDVKPSNIWLESKAQASGTPSVKLLDFGLAHDPNEDTQLTQQGVLIGTPAYMSPEQASGLPVDVRSDLFSLGTVLYVIAGGQFPFSAPTAIATLRAIAEKTPVPLAELNPSLPKTLVAVIEKLLAKDPTQRFASAEQVVAELRLVSQPALPNQCSSNLRHRLGRRQSIAACILLLAVVGLGVCEAAGLTHLTQSRASKENPTLDAPQPTLGSEPGDVQVAAVADEKKIAEEQKAPTVYPVALLTFEDRGTKDVGGKVVDLLFAKLAGNDALYLVDRTDLKKVLAEAELNISGAVKEPNKVGQLTGAKLLITGSVIQVEKKIILSAKLIGTETSRVAGVSVEGKTSDDLTKLVEQLAVKLAAKITDKAPDLVARTVPDKDRIAALKAKLKKVEHRPAVFIQVSERHVGLPSIDPAAQTELALFCKEVGCTVVDEEDGMKSKADYIIKGEGISETLVRNGNLVSVKTRLEVKIVDRKTAQVVAVDRQTVVVVDLAERIAGKTGLQEAAAQIAERVLPKFVKD